MKYLGVIPARGGSKGIPKKNIKLLKGKPLILYTIEAAQNSNLDKIVVSTDCIDTANIALSAGVEVIMRPANLALDNSPTLPTLEHAYQECGAVHDAVITLQPTSPLRTEKHINEAISIFTSDDNADSLVSVVKLPHNFSPAKVMTYDGKYLNGETKPQRRQEIDDYYARNGAAIYITKSCHLNEYVFGGNILPYFMKLKDSFDIDDMEDWMLVESVIE